MSAEQAAKLWQRPESNHDQEKEIGQETESNTADQDHHLQMDDASQETEPHTQEVEATVVIDHHDHPTDSRGDYGIHHQEDKVLLLKDIDIETVHDLEIVTVSRDQTTIVETVQMEDGLDSTKQ